MIKKIELIYAGMHPGPQGPPGFPQHQHMQGPQPGQGPPQRGPPPGSMGGEHHTLININFYFIFFSFFNFIMKSHYCMHDIEGMIVFFICALI